MPEYKDIIIFKDNLIEININKKIKDIKLKGLYSLNNNLSDSYKINLIQNSEILDFDANINLNNLFLNFKSLDYKNHIVDININSKFYFLSDENKQPNLGDAKILISKKKN